MARLCGMSTSWDRYGFEPPSYASSIKNGSFSLALIIIYKNTKEMKILL